MTEILEARIAPAALADLFQFANTAGTTDVVATDSSGNIYVAGIFTGTIGVAGSGVPSVTTADPLGDVYYAKFLPDGQLFWLGRWGGTGPETVGEIMADGVGDLFVTGSFDSASAGFGGSGALATTAGNPQLFIFKAAHVDGAAVTAFSGDGQLQYGDPAGAMQGVSLALAGTSALYVGGTFNGTLNPGNFTVVSDGEDGFVLSLVPDSGALQSGFGSLGVVAVEVTSNANDRLFRIALTSDSSVLAGVRSVLINQPLTPEVFAIQKYDGSTGARDDTFGILGINANAADADFAVDGSDRIIAASATGNAVVLSRFAGASPDLTFGTSGGFVVSADALSVSVLLDSTNRIYVGGVTATADYIVRIKPDGAADTIFGSSVPQVPNASIPAFFGKHTSPANAHLGMALDPNGYLILRDGYTGATTDLDPTSSIRRLAPRTGLGAGMEETFIVRVDLAAIASGKTARIPGTLGIGEILISLTGPGFFRFEEADGGGVESIELFDTTLASTLSVAGSKLSGTEIIGKILASGTRQHVGTIKVGPQFILGFGDLDSDPEILVTGKLNTLILGDVRDNALIKLGVDLPYDVPGDTTTPDTYNNRPTLTIGTITGPGVVIENIGDGTNHGIGGGGFGNIVIGSWAFPGFLRTTQSIGNFTVKQNDFMAVLEIDKFHVGNDTTANTGMMNVQNGAWGSSGTEVEGNIAGFNAEEFLAGASITAGSIGAVTTDAGSFNGTLTLTNADASAVPTFTVSTDFTGRVVSAAPLKKIVIKGDFRGSLTAPSIAAITAFSFHGATAADPDGDADKRNITTTAGLLGLITAKSGIITNYEFTSMVAPFGGIKVTQNKLTNSVIGVNNVKVSAPSIGTISVSLTASPANAGVNLTGIADSIFTTTDAGAKIGAITVKLLNANGASTGISDTTFTGGTIGNVLVNVNKGKGAGATARALHDADFIARDTLGNLTILGSATEAQASGLRYISGGKIGAVSIKAAKAEFGAMSNSTILAGQLLDFTGATTAAQIKAKLLGASLLSFNASGGVAKSIIGAGANIGAVTVGGALSQSHILAGTRLGADRALGGGDDTFQRAAKIAAVTVKGAYSQTNIAAGVNSVNGIYGDDDDVLGAAVAASTQGSEIGSVSIGTGAVAAPGQPHTFAIEAAKIAKLLVKGQPPVTSFTQPSLLDVGAAGEDADDVIVRVL